MRSSTACRTVAVMTTANTLPTDTARDERALLERMARGDMKAAAALATRDELKLMIDHRRTQQDYTVARGLVAVIVASGKGSDDLSITEREEVRALAKLTVELKFSAARAHSVLDRLGVAP